MAQRPSAGARGIRRASAPRRGRAPGRRPAPAPPSADRRRTRPARGGQALEPLRHGAPVPPEGSRRRLHVEPVLAQADENRRVAGGIDLRLARRGEPQVLWYQDRSIGERDRLAETVLELADVAGPVVPLERAQRRLRERRTPARLGAGVLQEANRQWSHVLAALAERRQAEHQALQAEVEVLAEPTLRDAALEGPIAGGDDPHVHRGGTCRPDPVEGLFLKNAEELRLVVGPQLTDLVQEDRSAVGLLEIPPPLRDGTGEATPDVAEQLALEQLGRDGGHVDRDERRTGAGAQAVGRPREQLLACSGLARYQNRQRRARRLLQIPEARQNLRTPGDDSDLRAPLPQPLLLGVVELCASGVGGAQLALQVA